MLYNNHSQTDENFGERLDEAVERIARDASALSEELTECVERLAVRHKLAREIASAEQLAHVPTKTLEKQVALIQQIRAIDYLADEDLDQLKQRLECLQTIRRLEPGAPTPIKKLRERARLLERAELAELALSSGYDAEGDDEATQ